MGRGHRSDLGEQAVGKDKHRAPMAANRAGGRAQEEKRPHGLRGHGHENME